MENRTLSSVTAEKTFNSGQPQDAGDNERPQRIGGVLILIAIGLVISLLQNVGYCLSSLAPVLKRPVWDSVTNPISLSHHPYWKSVLIYEAATSSAILLMNVIMLWLFFRKKRMFPKLVVMMIPVFFVLNLLGYYFSGFIPTVAASALYAKQGKELVISFVALHIWIPYFLLSKRVKRTFVR